MIKARNIIVQKKYPRKNKYISRDWYPGDEIAFREKFLVICFTLGFLGNRKKRRKNRKKRTFSGYVDRSFVRSTFASTSSAYTLGMNSGRNCIDYTPGSRLTVGVDATKCEGKPSVPLLIQQSLPS